MSGAKAKLVSEINLEEFERRLRAASAPHGGIEDPLAELTRLVDTIAADRPVDDKIVELSSARLPKVERTAPAPEARRARDINPAPPPTPEETFNDEDMAPPVLRAAIEETHDAEFEPEMGEPTEEVALARPARRASSWYIKVGALGALAVVMGAGAVAMKVGMPGRPKTPPMILADSAPTKVAPPTESAVHSPGDSGSLLLKDSAAPASAPVKIVNHEEQPVDLGARAAATPTPLAVPTKASAVDGSPVAPTADTPVVALAEPSGPAVSSTLSTGAKPVKTVSVRPDGTLISVDTPSTVAPPPASTPVTAPKKSDASPLAATPTIDLPAKSATKSSARVTATKTDTTVPDDAAGVPTQRAEKPAKLPTKLRPPAAAVDAASSDAAPADAAPAAGSGQWSVQFAAPRSESDARNAIARLKNKYAEALGGASIGVHKAEAHGETLYRVRASGLSKAEASALCSKLKDAGGDCFLSKN
jgi:hypothetical protein